MYGHCETRWERVRTMGIPHSPNKPAWLTAPPTVNPVTCEYKLTAESSQKEIILFLILSTNLPVFVVHGFVFSGPHEVKIDPRELSACVKGIHLIREDEGGGVRGCKTAKNKSIRNAEVGSEH